jgi:hypothetical protein
MALGTAERAQVTRPREAARARWQSPRAVAYAAGACLLAGVLWRLVRYLAQFPIWGDEGFILLNVLERDYAGLTGRLTASQVAPLLFLWSEKLALDTLGNADWAVRLLPFLAGTAALGLFAWGCRRHVPALTAALATSVFAASYFPVRHACEVKPYAFDLLASVGFLVGALGWLGDGRRRWLVFLVLWSPFALAASYPAIFVAGAAGLVLLRKMRSAPWATRGLYALFCAAAVGTFVAHYATIGRAQAGADESRQTHDFMQSYWHEGFPPAEPWRVPGWLLNMHTSMLFAYPFGSSNGGSTASFLLAIAGGVYLWRTGRRSLLGLCVLPFALGLVAACLHKYPYGVSARISQHLAAPVCLLVGAGIASLLVRLGPARQNGWAVGICVALAAVAVGGAVRDLVRPYKTEHEMALRTVAGEFWAVAEPGDAVLVCNSSGEFLTPLAWYVRRDGRPVYFYDEPARPDATTRRLWLLRAHPNADTAEQMRVLAGVTGPRWRVADFHQQLLPKERHDEPHFHVTRVLLVGVADSP